MEPSETPQPAENQLELVELLLGDQAEGLTGIAEGGMMVFAASSLFRGAHGKGGGGQAPDPPRRFHLVNSQMVAVQNDQALRVCPELLTDGRMPAPHGRNVIAEDD